mmetsp:Transcript_18107/g.43550  ORF Transcript_18107/g.43550 Transcript_18107/m.43550 type:complete len:235 (-) Transcript_18107:341-1045(-)
MPSCSAALEYGDQRTKPISRRTKKGTIRSPQQVRNKLFQKLGICSHHRSYNISVAERSVRDLRDMPRFDEPLKYDHKVERLRETRRLSRQSSSAISSLIWSSPTDVKMPPPYAMPSKSSSKQKKRVKFHESVAVVPIPMHREYSDRVRSKLWTDAVEMCETIERNMVEFSAESCDWRCVCLEDEMYVCGVTGELIHPAHVQTNQYVFGSGAGGYRQPYSLSNERQRYWDAQDVI